MDTGPLNLMVISNDYSRLHSAAMLAVIAGSFGRAVRVFVSMEALPAFHQDESIRANAVTKGPVARKVLAQGADDYLALFRQAKEFGDVALYACGLVADVYKWTLTDLMPLFDDVMGVSGFLHQAEEGTTLVM